MGLNYGIGYRKISEARRRITRFAKIFLPRPLHSNLVLINIVV